MSPIAFGVLLHELRGLTDMKRERCFIDFHHTVRRTGPCDLVGRGWRAVPEGRRCTAPGMEEVAMKQLISHVQDHASEVRRGQMTARRPAPETNHVVSAIYPHRRDAEAVRDALIEHGIAGRDISVLHRAQGPLSDEVLKDMLVEGMIGTAVGTGVGALGMLAIAAANVTLFVASPVVAPLAMLGWFAGVGGLLGAAVGADKHTQGKLSDLVKDAIEAGHTVLIVRTHSEAERSLAVELINRATEHQSAH